MSKVKPEWPITVEGCDGFIWITQEHTVDGRIIKNSIVLTPEQLEALHEIKVMCECEPVRKLMCSKCHGHGTTVVTDYQPSTACHTTCARCGGSGFEPVVRVRQHIAPHPIKQPIYVAPPSTRVVQSSDWRPNYEPGQIITKCSLCGHAAHIASCRALDAAGDVCDC